MKNKARQSGSPMQSEHSSTKSAAKGKLDKEIQAKIGLQLRAIYDEIVQEGVPERFTELLRRFEKRDDGEPQK